MSKKIALLFLALSCPAWALAVLQPEKIHTADGKKTQAYVHDGLFVGGDRAIDDVTVTDIRHASNSKYERVVIDLAVSKSGEPAAIERPPFYQVAVSPEERRLVFTIWGKPKLAFNPKKVAEAFKKSLLVSEIQLLPRVEDDSWTFVLALKTGKPVEVFELTNPARIIVDVGRGGDRKPIKIIE